MLRDPQGRNKGFYIKIKIGKLIVQRKLNSVEIVALGLADSLPCLHPQGATGGHLDSVKDLCYTELGIYCDARIDIRRLSPSH